MTPTRSTPSSDAQMSEGTRATKNLTRKCDNPNLAPSQWAVNVANLALHTDLTGLATAKPLNILTTDVLKYVRTRPTLIWELSDVMQRVWRGAICPDYLLQLGELHKGKSRDELFRGQLVTNQPDENMMLQYLQAQALHQAFPPDSKRRANIMFKIMHKMCEQHDSIIPFDINNFRVHELYKPRLVDKKPINRVADFVFISRLESTNDKTMVGVYKQMTHSRLPFNPVHSKFLAFSPMCGGVVIREGEGDIIQAEASLHMNAWHAATILHMKRLCRYIRLDYDQHPAPASIGLKIVNDTWTISVGYSMLVDDEEKLCVEDIAVIPVLPGNVAGIYQALRMMNAILEYFKLFHLPWITKIVIPTAIKTFSNHGVGLVPRTYLVSLDERDRQARSSSISSGLWSMVKIQSRGEETSAEQQNTRMRYGPPLFALSWPRRGAVRGDIYAEDSHGLMLVSEYDVLGCGSGFASTFHYLESW
ncbi:uncharacterized protein KD926_007976 [Aspergillus affinis]|uniref:uncharacterized protein n=1 Tax=Aspergillus affinis TaxID=1070780 RepID=UPI0022FEA7FF|nr:uncharacterized protein KD926_007976 [Aspergillus affinis]KAI9045560.1 hypothetical protein KD926_007976 [Aspergillus affinis]